MKVRVGDVEIAYDRQGSGEPVLLVMGLGTPRIGWFHQFFYLAEHYDVTCFDNRGVGETVVTAPMWTVEDMAGDALGLADVVGYETFHLVGISMGGMISQEIALASPDRIRSLTLMATTPGGPEAEPMTPEFSQVFMIPDPQERIRRSVELMFGEEFRRHNPEMIDLMVRFAARDGSPVTVLGAEADTTAGFTGAAGFMAQIAAVTMWLGAGGAAARLHEIDVPTLVLHGGEDHLLPVGNGKLLAREIRGAKLRIWEKSGHALNAEYPDEVNAELVRHLEGASAKV